MNIGIKSAAWLALTLLVTGAASAEPVDLLQAWQSAQEHDAAFAAARAERRVGEQKHRQSRALLLPQVQAVGALGIASMSSRTSGAQFTAPGFGTSNDVDFRIDVDRGHAERWTIAAQQPLYDAERFANSRQLDKQAELSEVKYANAQQDLILRVAQSYFDLALAEDTEYLLNAERDSAQRALDEAQQRFRSGDIPVTDANEAQARFDAISAQLLAANADSAIKRSAFIDMTGLDSANLQKPVIDTREERSALSEWQQRASNNNPLLTMQSLGVDIAQADIDKYRALTAPVVALVAQAGDDRVHGDGDYGAGELQNSNWMVGVQVTVPIFTGGMRSAKHAEALAQTDKAQSDLVALRQLIARQTQSAWLGVTTGAAQVRALEQAKKSAQLRLDATQLGHANGARSTLELLNAQTDAFAAERALRQAQYALLLNRLRLAAVAGVLDETTLHNVSGDTTSVSKASPPHEG
ncbi:MAG: TolC family outer membrane protein [Spongiibacteraceae bacterium]